MPKLQFNVFVTIMIMAIVLALGSILSLTYLQGRPAAPEGQTIKNVEGVDVQIVMDPAQQVQVLPLGAEAAPVVTQPEQQATAVSQPIEQPTTDPVILTAIAQAQQPTADLSQQPQQTLPTNTPLPPAPTLPPAAPTRDPNPVIQINYLVQSSDTLYGITRNYATSIALMSLYGLSQEDLVPGSTISLPVGNPGYCPGRRPYAVGEGDTAYSVARRYGTTAADLQSINGLDANFTIRVGEIICVPL